MLPPVPNGDETVGHYTTVKAIKKLVSSPDFMSNEPLDLMVREAGSVQTRTVKVTLCISTALPLPPQPPPSPTAALSTRCSSVAPKNGMPLPVSTA
jgi:hypothetical protein